MDPRSSKIKILSNNERTLEFKDFSDLYHLEIKIYNDIISDKKEASFPGTKKIDILLNSK